MTERPAESSLPERIATLLREARWLILGLIAAYLALILYGYHQADPAWSHAGSGIDPVVNPGGRVGAWIADVLLYLFGISAWWWVAFLAFLVVAGYRRLNGQWYPDRRPFFVALAGFAILISASSGLEALRFHSAQTALPFSPGGLVGYEVARIAARQFGFVGGTLALIGVIAVSFSLFTGLSWIELSERTGGAIERLIGWVGGAWQAWRDRRIGREVAEKREAVIEIERLRQVAHEPVLIEPIEVEVEKSVRAERERQQPLFKDLPESALPPLSLLDDTARDAEPPSAETLAFTSRLIERKLGDFGVEVKVLAALPGPVITRFEIEPAVGVKGSQIVNLVKDLARALSVVSIRVVETIPGKTCMGLEIPNAKRQVVRLAEILGSVPYHDMHSPLTLALGKDIGGAPAVADLGRMPHVLVAGTTGSGKSVAINAMILSLVYKSEPSQVRLILVDPKMLELSVYEGIPHLAAPVVTDMKQAANALAWCVAEMERRYKLMSVLAVRNLSGFNHKLRDAEKAGTPLTDPFAPDPAQAQPLAPLPHIVVVIDELADLMMVVGKKVEELIARLAQKARAAGIHLILATQRPSVDVITGLIKANIPCRVAFQVSSKVDSRTILDQSGAEALLGQGDMLYLSPGTGLPMRVHGAFVADAEVHRVVDHLKGLGRPDYVSGILEEASETDAAGENSGSGEDDPLYDQAVQMVIKTRRPSISLVQRHLRIGYNRAARLIENMERAGLVSAMGTNGNREVLVPARD